MPALEGPQLCLGSAPPLLFNLSLCPPICPPLAGFLSLASELAQGSWPFCPATSCLITPPCPAPPPHPHLHQLPGHSGLAPGGPGTDLLCRADLVPWGRLTWESRLQSQSLRVSALRTGLETQVGRCEGTSRACAAPLGRPKGHPGLNNCPVFFTALLSRDSGLQMAV